MRAALTTHLRRDLLVVQLLHAGQHACHDLAIQRVVCAWVVDQPEHTQVRQAGQVADVVDVSDVVLAQVQLLWTCICSILHWLGSRNVNEGDAKR